VTALCLHTSPTYPPTGLWSRPIRQGPDHVAPPPVTARAAVSTSSGGSAITASCLQATQRREGCSRSVVHTFRPQWPPAARCRAQASLPHTGQASTLFGEDPWASTAHFLRCAAPA